MMQADKNKILIVDDSPFQARLMAGMVASDHTTVLTASSGREALQIIGSEEPRIVITDWRMPEMDGLELCRTLREHEGVRFIYVILVTCNEDDETVVEAFEAGADDFMRKPLNKAELNARLHAADRIVRLESDLAKGAREVHRVNAEMALTHRRLNKANDQLKRMATTDELTGLLNRREAMARMQEFWDAQERYDQVFSCIMLDIDHFKTFNDTHGHAAGDAVLKQTARLLRESTRKTDRVCRVGGEEFLILCPNVGIEGGGVCAEHVREGVEGHAFTFEDKTMEVTVSLGVAHRTDGIATTDELLKAADDALYASKHAGRNRVTVAGAEALADAAS